jgi:hypothetical protein
MSMMEEMQMKKNALKSGGNSSPQVTAKKTPEAPKGFNTAMLGAGAAKAPKPASNNDDSDDDWGDVDDGPTKPVKPAAPSGIVKRTASGPPETSSNPPPPKVSAAAAPAPKPAAPKPAAPAPAPAPAMSWKEKNALKQKEDKARKEAEAAAKAEKVAAVKAAAPASARAAPAPAPAPAPAKPAAARPAFNGGGGGSADEAEVAELKEKLKTLTENISAEKKKAFDLQKENDALRARIQEVESSPGKTRRDSAAFGDLMSLKGDQNAELEESRRESGVYKKQVEDLKKQLREAGSGGGGGGGGSSETDMREMSSLRDQLHRARKEKEKALKLVIKIVGKQAMASHLKAHESTGDGLASLIENFGGAGVSGGGGSPKGRVSPTKPSMTLASPRKDSPGAEFKRSRMDSYYRTSGVGSY